MGTRMHGGAVGPMFQRARELRDRCTHAEEVLWGFLKTKPFGFKFRRQHPYAFYILDFYCHSLKIVVEVDGSIHDLDKVKENDKKRQLELENDGLLVIRFSNDEVEKKQEEVIKSIEEIILKRKDEQDRK